MSLTGLKPDPVVHGVHGDVTVPVFVVTSYVRLCIYLCVGRLKHPWDTDS